MPNYIIMRLYIPLSFQTTNKGIVITDVSVTFNLYTCIVVTIYKSSGIVQLNLFKPKAIHNITREVIQLVYMHGACCSCSLLSNYYYYRIPSALPVFCADYIVRNESTIIICVHTRSQ